ncbi:hypothetical protein GCM10010524_13650 [Streptomyces mexicanus]
MADLDAARAEQCRRLTSGESRRLAESAQLVEGRGLALVKACADLWGWQPLSREGNRGKVVWCELAAA